MSGVFFLENIFPKSDFLHHSTYFCNPIENKFYVTFHRDWINQNVDTLTFKHFGSGNLINKLNYN